MEFIMMLARNVMTYFFICLIFLLTACGSNNVENSRDTDSSEIENNQDEDVDEEKEDTAKAEVTDLLVEGPADISVSDYDVVEIDDPSSTDRHDYAMANDGYLLLGGNSMIDVVNYKDGKMQDVFEGLFSPDSHIAARNLSFELSENLFYSKQNESGETDDYITELDLDTGNSKEIISLDDLAQVPIMEKQHDILYMDDGESLIAYHTKKDEEVWKTTIDSSKGLYNILLTENQVVVYGFEGFTVYQKEDGDEVISFDRSIVRAETDEEYIYVLESTEEAGLHDNQWRILRFHEDSDEPETLTTSREVADYTNAEDINMTIDDKMIYLSLPYGVMAFDKTNGTEKWASAVDKDFTNSDSPVTELDTVAHDGKLYMLTEITGDWEYEHLLSIVDGETGEVEESYSIGNGDVFGPFFDGEHVIMSHVTSDPYEIDVYIID